MGFSRSIHVGWTISMPKILPPSLPSWVTRCHTAAPVDSLYVLRLTIIWPHVSVALGFLKSWGIFSNSVQSSLREPDFSHSPRGLARRSCEIWLMHLYAQPLYASSWSVSYTHLRAHET